MNRTIRGLKELLEDRRCKSAEAAPEQHAPQGLAGGPLVARAHGWQVGEANEDIRVRGEP